MKKANLLKATALAFALCLGTGVYALTSPDPSPNASADVTTPTCDIVGKTLSLEDNIYIYYIADFQNTLESDHTGILVWTAPQETYDVTTANTNLTTITDYTYNQTTAIYYPSYAYEELSAKQMTEMVYACPYVERGGEYYYGEVEKYSILQYAYKMTGKMEAEASTDTDLINLLKAMLNYGAAAQTYHKYNTDRLATDDFTYVNIDNAYFEDGYSFGFYKPNEEVKLTLKEGYQLGSNLPDYIKINENGEIILTVPQEKLVLDYLVIEETAYSQGLKYTLLSDDTYAVSGLGTCTDTDIIIPDTYEGKAVTAIGDNTFENCTSLTSVNIPTSVTTIGNLAFNNCDNLQGLYITSIEAWCNIDFYYPVSNPLYYAKNLYLNNTLVINLVIPDTVAQIKNYAFYNCTSITNVNIPDPVTSIGCTAFYGCNGLTNVTIGNGVTSIEEQAFYNCSSLTSITIPNSVTYIGYLAFGGCTNLIYNSYDNGLYLGNDNNKYLVFIKASSTNISSCYIHNTTKVIYCAAFLLCKNLTGITIPNSIISISAEAFYDCNNLKSIKIPDSVTFIGDRAFSGCSSLTSVTIGNSVISIGSRAFYNCIKLKNITIPNSVSSIGDRAFYGCSSLTNVTFENTESWQSTNSNMATSGAKISSEKLANSTIAASFLTGAYSKYYWKRTITE